MERYQTVSRQRKGNKESFLTKYGTSGFSSFCKIRAGVLKRIITKISFMVLLIQQEDHDGPISLT